MPEEFERHGVVREGGRRVRAPDPIKNCREMRASAPVLFQFVVSFCLFAVMEKILLSHRSHKFLPVCAAFATISNVLPTCPPTSKYQYAISTENQPTVGFRLHRDVQSTSPIYRFSTGTYLLSGLAVLREQRRQPHHNRGI
jgi:hypothetical protein